MNAPITQKYYLPCQCSSHDHLVVLEYDEELGLMISIQLVQWQGFFKRLWSALRYVLNMHGPRYGLTWDTCMVRPGDVKTIKAWVQNADIYGAGLDYGAVGKIYT